MGPLARITNFPMSALLAPSCTELDGYDDLHGMRTSRIVCNGLEECKGFSAILTYRQEPRRSPTTPWLPFFDRLLMAFGS